MIRYYSLMIRWPLPLSRYSPPPSHCPPHSSRYLAPPLPPLLLFPWRAAGAIFGTAGVALVLWAGTIFTRVGTAIHPLARSSFLVRSGPFRFSRNPIYLGMVLILSGAALALGSATPWLIIPGFIWVIARQVVAGEERKLTAEFGAEYLEYCTRVRRWL